MGETPKIQRYVRPELLAPAGGREQLEYAIRFGADAVYLATERFGMRKRASNFSIAELPEVVAYAHEHGVRVHVACNVVVQDRQLGELASYAEAVERAGADALIVSDLGALRVLRRHAPHVAIHVSTQASVANAEAALVWYGLGATRIVCAREMSLEQIAAMRRKVPDDLELEAFVHGSMCMAYSGRCMVSDYLTGRAANGGNCTQPCRWEWRLQEPSRPDQVFGVEEDEEGSYLFNSCDLNMVAHLDALAAAGVDSVKLEGRGRKAFYVATVTNAYRRVLDGAEAADVAGELETISHRPYSTGFYFGPAHQAPRSRGSEQGWLWAAEVVGTSLKCDDGWETEVVARNRFAVGDVLEVLSPGIPTGRVVVRGLRWEHLGEDGSHLDEPVAVAGRQMERYRLTGTAPLKPYDILRRRIDEKPMGCDEPWA